MGARGTRPRRARLRAAARRPAGLRGVRRPDVGQAVVRVAVAAMAACWVMACVRAERQAPIAIYMAAFCGAALLVKSCVAGYRKAHAAVMGNDLSRRLVTDFAFRVGVEVHVSLVVDGVYGAVLLVAGIATGSFWYAATGVYYLLLAVLRAVLARSLRVPDDCGGRRAAWGSGGLRGLVGRMDASTRAPGAFGRELKAFRLCAVLLLVLDLAFTGVVTQMVRDGRGAAYPGDLIYLAALLTFCIVAIAVANLVRSRGLDRPTVWACKALDVSTGLVSILLLQTAMLASFVEGREQFKRAMNGVTGLVVCLAIAAIAVAMLIKERRLRGRGDDPGGTDGTDGGPDDNT